MQWLAFSSGEALVAVIEAESTAKSRMSKSVADQERGTNDQRSADGNPAAEARRTFTLVFFPGSRASVSSPLTLIESRVIPLRILVLCRYFS